MKKATCFLRDMTNCRFKYAKIFSNFYNLNVFSRKTRIVNSLSRRLCKNLSKNSVQKLCDLLSFTMGFPKSYKMLKSYDWKYVYKYIYAKVR